jgi:dipeptidyl aminopeptidase/acylaminoacyl peptidase
MAPRLFLVCVALVTIACVSTPAMAEPDHTADFTLASFLEIPTLISPTVSPDGKQVAWRETRRDLEEDSRITRLYLGNAKTGKVRQLSYLDEGTGALAWRPDGSLSFLRSHDAETQVWINPLDGSEPRPVTAVEGGVGAYWWSPCGHYLAVLADPAEPEDEATEDESDGSDDREDWTVFDRLEQPQEYQQLWLVGATDIDRDEEFEPRQLTEKPWHPYHVAWSPDGQTMAVTFNARFSSLVDEDQQLALIHVADGSIDVFTPADRHASHAAFSPDGKRLAYYMDSQAEYRTYLNLKDLIVRDLASGEDAVMTPGNQLTLGGYGSTPGEAPVWDAKGRSLFLRAADGVDLDLYHLDTKDKKLKALTDLDGSMVSLSIAGGTAAYVESALDKPGTLYAGTVGGRRKAIATVNQSVAKFDLQPALFKRLPGHEGGTVEAFLFLPPDAGENDKLPAIIEMHGGPFSRYGNAWTTRYPWQVLARNGFAVLIVNPRGGTGYGAEFLRGVYRNFGTDDFQDIMAAVDELVAQGTIDADRLGFTGYSYGGLMTNVVVSRTDRFKAAVSIAGIWNYVSAMGQNNPQLFIDSYRRPWDDDLQLMWEHSPAARADRIVTPTLVMHGKDDEPVDPRQSIEMFSYLQLNGIPSRLVLYPDEGHGINKPSHMIDYQTRELQWFRHFVLGEAEAVGAEDPVPVER